jgi:hypothetical protein
MAAAQMRRKTLTAAMGRLSAGLADDLGTRAPFASRQMRLAARSRDQPEGSRSMTVASSARILESALWIWARRAADQP